MAEDADIPVTSSNNNAANQNSDSAMARLLLARSMAQRAQAMAESSSGNGSSVMATSENFARTPERKIGSVSPHPSSMKSEDDRTPSPTNMTPTPPVQMSEVTRDRSPINPHDREDVRDFIRDQRHFDPLRIDAVDHGNDATYALPDSSPENQGLDSASDNPSKFYKCRLCNFYATTYTQLQLHMPKHGGMKALKCPLCDYATNDKSNFRRHRRLHMGTNPVSVLKCGKCSYSTILPRKFREHYSQVHNEQLDTNVPYSHQPHTHFRPQGFTDTQFGIGPMDMSQHKPHHSPSNGNLAATNALHSLLTGIHHQNPPMGYRTQTYPTQGQCINQYGNYLTPVRQTNEENHLASNYLRSIVSSIMNTHPPNRIPPSSTITSSNFYLSPMAQEQQHMTATQSSILSSSRSHDLDLSIHNLSSDVKVKVEPPERDGTPDVSSSAIPHHHHSIHDMSQQISMSTYPRGYSELSENNVTVDANEASTSVDVMRTNSTDSTQFPRRENRSSTDNGINTTIKTELTSVGVQCSLSQLKSESLYLSIERSLLPKVDQGVQCELVSGNNRCNQRSHSVASESECSEPQSNRCPHCGIMFDDEVLYSIHIGCHSHTDPFVCNVCGKQCGNKYGFYSHIMRGHHY